MQNEILKPVLDSDEAAVPRYNIVGPDGKVIQRNVELRLQNEIVQEGTPYDEASVLPPELRDQLGLPQSATPAEAFSAVLKKAGGAMRRNRPPTDTDAESVGKLWVVPEMAFHNMMPNAITQSTSSWSPSATTVSVASNAVTAAGNGGAATTLISATMNASVRVGDIVFTQLHVTVNHDANMVVAELTLGNQVLATKTLNVPAAGDTMLLQARTAAETSGTPVLKIYATYNTAAVQSGKGFTVKDITVWNLTGDMCEAQEGNEFTQAEAISYINSFGQFQTREYEYSTWWWILRGVDAGQYFWHRVYDYATTAEAQSGSDETKVMTAKRTQEFYTHRQATTAEAQTGTDDSHWMSSLKTQQVLTSRLATQSEAEAGDSDTKWMSPKKVKAWWDKLYSTLILPIAKGGTGLSSAPSMLTNLASTTAASPLQASPRPGVTGTLSVANGGTGKASWTANRIAYPSAATTMSQLAFPSTAESVLAQKTSGAPYWRADIATLLDLLKGLSTESGDALDITWKMTAGVSNGATVASGAAVTLSKVNDYAEFTATVPGASATKYLFYLSPIQFVTGGSSGAPANKYTLYVGTSTYDLGKSSSGGYDQRMPSVHLAKKCGKVASNATIKIRMICVTNPANQTVSVGIVGRTLTSPARVYTKGGMA